MRLVMLVGAVWAAVTWERVVIAVPVVAGAALLLAFVSGPPDRLWLYWPGVALVAVAVAAMFAESVAAWWRARHDRAGLSR